MSCSPPSEWGEQNSGGHTLWAAAVIRETLRAGILLAGGGGGFPHPTYYYPYLFKYFACLIIQTSRPQMQYYRLFCFRQDDPSCQGHHSKQRWCCCAEQSFSCWLPYPRPSESVGQPSGRVRADERCSGVTKCNRKWLAVIQCLTMKCVLCI